MTSNAFPAAEALIRAVIENAPEIGPGPDTAGAPKPLIRVDACNPNHTVGDLRDVLATSGHLYDRGVPVRLVYDRVQKGMAVETLSPDALVLLAHQIGRPVTFKPLGDGQSTQVDARLPRSAASMYLDWRGGWHLPILNGVASSPLLREDGAIVTSLGHDPETGMWLEDVPGLAQLSEHPTKEEASAALHRVRITFRTFCFADAAMVQNGAGPAVVDTGSPPARDESAFLVALLTAVCRPSLALAPGVLLSAPSLSGAGAGKGLLARCISLIAYGREPHAVTGGATAEELEKRIAAELMNAAPVLFLDNLNDTALRSDLLASAITERPARVRVLGQSKMVNLNPSALVILTGNGLSVSEDLVRRFISVELDPRTEQPEARSFPTNPRLEVLSRRPELLADLLTIWRWGRQAEGLERGRPLGSFDQWCRWVRDPLLALGCRDPAERIAHAKQNDVRRDWLAEVFEMWWKRHAGAALPLRALHADVVEVIDRQQRNRQHLAAVVKGLVGTRVSGYMLTRQDAAGRWGASTYALERTTDDPTAAQDHRDHRDHRDRHGLDAAKSLPPMVPMVPMPCPPGPLCPSDAFDEDAMAFLDERAAIAQYDGQLLPAQAEALAMSELVAFFPRL